MINATLSSMRVNYKGSTGSYYCTDRSRELVLSKCARQVVTSAESRESTTATQLVAIRLMGQLANGRVTISEDVSKHATGLWKRLIQSFTGSLCLKIKPPDK